MSSREMMEDVARRWIGLWSAPVDWALFDQLHAEDFEDCSSASRPSDRAGFGEGIRRLIAAFPDLATTADDVVVDEPRGRVAVRWTSRGTNRQAYLGVGPTGRMTTITGIEIIEIRNGKITRRWGEWDITGHLSGQA